MLSDKIREHSLIILGQSSQSSVVFRIINTRCCWLDSTLTDCLLPITSVQWLQWIDNTNNKDSLKQLKITRSSSSIPWREVEYKSLHPLPSQAAWSRDDFLPTILFFKTSTMSRKRTINSGLCTTLVNKTCWSCTFCFLLSFSLMTISIDMAAVLGLLSEWMKQRIRMVLTSTYLHLWSNNTKQYESSVAQKISQWVECRCCKPCIKL